MLAIHNNNFSQGAQRTKVHVYLISRGNFVLCIYCTFKPNKYISVCWTRSDFLWAPANTFLFKFPYKTIIVKKGEISDSFLAKTTCVLER